MVKIHHSVFYVLIKYCYKSCSNSSLTCETDKPIITWIALPFLTTPSAPADLNTLSDANLLSSFTVKRKRVAQFVTSTIFSFPPKASKIPSAFLAVLLLPDLSSFIDS